MLHITLHGAPAATELLGISFVTIDPNPIMQLSPISTPFRIVTSLPMYILLPIFTRPDEATKSLYKFLNTYVQKSCVIIVKLSLISTLLPISINDGLVISITVCFGYLNFTL